MPESKHPVFFVVYVSGAILLLLLMVKTDNECHGIKKFSYGLEFF